MAFQMLRAVPLLLLLAWPGQCGNILFWLDVASKSHYEVWKPLIMALVERNHTATVVTPFSYKPLETNRRVKYIQTGVELSRGLNSSDIFDGHLASDLAMYRQVLLEAQDIVIEHPDIQELIQTKPKFNVSFVSTFSLDLGLYLAKEVFKTPVILMLTAQKQSQVDKIMGNPSTPSYITSEMLGYSQYMTFWQRMVNAITQISFPWLAEWYVNPVMSIKVQEVLGLDYPPDLTAMSHTIDFAMQNAHSFLEYVAPINPNTVLVGGMHLHKARPLDGQLGRWLDEAKHGVIYVSFGTVLTASHMSEEKRKTFVEAFSQLEQRVVWKWEANQLPGKPDNVMIEKWLPQQDILGHPNVKLFITHAGLLSIQESMYHRVPVLCMPGFADQPANSARSERMGNGRVLEWSDLTVDLLLSNIREIVNNDSYRERASFFGDLMQDTFAPSVDMAVFYTEYVMRHRGAQHWRSPAKDLYWFQYFLLDVFAFVAIVIVAVAYVFLSVLRCLLQRVAGRRDRTKMKAN